MLVGYILLPVLVLEVEMDDSNQYTIPKPQTWNYNPERRDKAAIANDPAQIKSPYFLRPKSHEDTVPRAMEADNVGNLPGAADESKQLSGVEQRLLEDHSILARQSMPTRTTPYIMQTNVLPDHQRKKILVTGGAGFVGSHLVDKLMMEGHEVIVVDNFFTGQKKNVAHWLHHPNFR